MEIPEIVEVILNERYDFKSNDDLREMSRWMVREIVDRAMELWMGGRADDCIGLESRGPLTGSEGSNPSPSAEVVG